MIKVDDKFLEDVGLGSLSGDRKEAFIAHTQEELEMRVGEKMSETLTLTQLEEFDRLVNNDRGTMIKILSRIGDYQSDRVYQNLLEKHNVSEGNMEILAEYLSVKWIQQNKPDYAEITREVAEQFKSEISKMKDEILAGSHL